jgi:NhaC family Na+:H+ antiporter
MQAIQEKFNVHLGLFSVPMVVVFLIMKKSPPLIALFIGTLLGGLFALFFQKNILIDLADASNFNFEVAYKGIMNSITVATDIKTSNSLLNDLFSSGGMEGMLGTIWLIICAMVFGGIMDAIGALNRISDALLSWAENTFQLFASTVASCLAINLTASDQYLSIVIPGKMFNKAYKERGLAPENLSRTLEDSGTVTSVLIPWNTCGAYQSGVLGVGVGDYFFYAIFNWLSPFITLLYAAFRIKIATIESK